MEQVHAHAAQVTGYETLGSRDPAEVPSPPPGPAARQRELSLSLAEKLIPAPEVLDSSAGLLGYDEATCHLLSEECAAAAGARGRVACVCLPCVFKSLGESHPDRHADWLLDFDPRSQAMGANCSILPVEDHTAVPDHLRHAFDVVVADLLIADEGWLDRVVDVMTLLARDRHQPQRLLLIAPAALEAAVARRSPGLRLTPFRPRSKRLGETDLRVYTTIFHSKRLGV